MGPEAMKVGELADRTGLSVRTLHHYDEIGLLAPAGRTPSGHRIYGLAQVRRLQQIASLRHLGLSLEEIRECLESPDYSLDRVLALQVERLRAEIGRQKRLVRLLEDLRRRLGGAEEISVDDIARTIEETTWHERYYTPEQRAAVARRADELGEARILRGQRDWSDLFEAFTRAMESGASPTDDDVQALASRANELIEEFTGGDPGIRDSLARMYREEGPEDVMGRHGVRLPDGLWAYYCSALGAYRAASAEGRPG
jgi:DNA-binding transcriptional MerR regulator